MANYYYQYLILWIIFQQNSISVIAQLNQYQSTDASNSRSMLSTTTISTVLYHNMDDNVYEDDVENIDGDEIYDEEGDYSLSTPVSESEFKNITSHLSDESRIKDDLDETGSYQESDDDDGDKYIYADTMSVDRSQLTRPTIVSDNKKPLDSSSTSRIPFVSSNLWRDLFSKPMILVGIIGGIVIGMLSAILLLMFIIYRMRKKDEGSYALEEAPRKSPSHAYTRVSSREFFA